jgi:predicted component of type VI protein secretion system
MLDAGAVALDKIKISVRARPVHLLIRLRREVMDVTLIVATGVHKGKSIPITTPTFLIGRAKHCHLRPLRGDVGREHCAVVVRDDRVFLRDLGSLNGTILNRQTMVDGEVELADGDVFEVGPLHFRVMITAPGDYDSCFSENDFFTGQPGEQEPAEDSTIQISVPNLKRVRPPTPPPDEGAKLC